MTENQPITGEIAAMDTIPISGRRRSGRVDVSGLFSQLFVAEQLRQVFRDRFSDTGSKGIDKLTGPQYATRIEVDSRTTVSKCLAGTHRFSPYLETLKLKGRNKVPRIIAIPTVRDRLVFHQLNKLLASGFPSAVPKNIANSIIRSIVDDLISVPGETTFVCSCDIRHFYDSISREKLLRKIRRSIAHKATLSLIFHALKTPIVPKNTPRSKYFSHKTTRGVPQGLAISNILASIYLSDVDEAIKATGVKYFRYVDDILIYGSETAVRSARELLVRKLRYLGLKIHPEGSGKSHLGHLTQEFRYLGYVFQWPAVTVRESTIEALLHSLAAKFSDFQHNSQRRQQRYKYLTPALQREIFLLELNERITGAISEKRKYGWVAYFSQINDLSLLHRLDHTVAAMFRRLTEFGRIPPVGLKKFSRSYFEMKFNPHGGYVRDYDVIDSVPEKLAFLVTRGRVGPDEGLTPEQIEGRFSSYRRRVLARMHADEGTIYG